MIRIDEDKVGGICPLEFTDCFIAGGAVLSRFTKTPIADYDIYPKSNEGILVAIENILSDGYVLNVTDKAITLKSNDYGDDDNRIIYQIMIFDTFETPEKIFENFDFTVTMGAYDCDEKAYYVDDNYLLDIASKTLRYNPNTRYPLNSLLRVRKYNEKGYFLSKPENIKMIMNLSDKGLPQSWEELEKEIGGTYGREINLRVEDKEFTLENLFEVMDSIHSFTAYEYQYEKFAGMKTEDFELFFDDTSGPIYSINDVYFRMDTNNTITKICNGMDHFDDIQEMGIESFSAEIVELNPDTDIFGYKLVDMKDDGGMHPVHYSGKHVYKLDETSVCEQRPHFFVYDKVLADRIEKTNARVSRSSNKILVKFKAGDIVKYGNGHGEITTKRITPVKVFDKLKEKRDGE